MNEIVTAIQFRDSVYIFTRTGTVYEMRRDEITRRVEFRVICDLFSRS